MSILYKAIILVEGISSTAGGQFKWNAILICAVGVYGVPQIVSWRSSEYFEGVKENIILLHPSKIFLKGIC